MFTGNTTSDVLPTHLVYKSSHLYDQWVTGGPVGARCNKVQKRDGLMKMPSEIGSSPW